MNKGSRRVYLPSERYGSDKSLRFSNDASLASTKSQDIGFLALTDSPRKTHLDGFVLERRGV